MPKTYNELYIETRNAFREMGIDAYNLEARTLLAFAAGKTKEQFLRDINLYTSSEMEKSVEELRKRRLDGEPLAYITSSWEFYGIPIKVTSNVLIPRVDTEVLVETTLNAINGRKMDARIIDLCTGSGCVGCALAKELPEARVVLADISREALSIAHDNAVMNNLVPRVNCMELNALEAPPMMIGIFDVLVCNPPYIPHKDVLELDCEVKDFEPNLALDGGEDGLDFYRSIISKWRNVVRIGGIVLFEVGIHQAEIVADIMKKANFKNVGIKNDTLGIGRVVYGNA